MGFAFSYEMRERARAAGRWLREHGRTAGLVSGAGALALVYLLFFLPPFGSRDMVILYRPNPDGAGVVFNLGGEYRLRSVRVLSLDESGHEGETLWRFDVPGDTPRLSTFSLPPGGRRSAMRGPEEPPLEPGRLYRLKVAAAGARGEADFRLDPQRRRPG